MTPACGSCIFRKEGLAIIECRRYPPIMKDHRSGWPLVSPNDWCGEWKNVRP